MTFLRSSDVKNHLYTGSGPKHHLISEEASPQPENKAAPAPSMGVIVSSDARPAIAVGASVTAELPFSDGTTVSTQSSKPISLVSKVKKAA